MSLSQSLQWASSSAKEKIYNEWTEELIALEKVRAELPKILIENDMLKKENVILKKELKACQAACKKKDKEIARLSSIATETEKANDSEKYKTNVKF
jgi:regulator of replication initiation timing